MPAYDQERRKWQNPEAILADIGLKAGFTFADLGCGGGYFVLPAARIVGKKGKVLGVDVSDGAIAALKADATKERLNNLTLTVGKAEDKVLCEGCADIVFIGIALHDFQDPAKVLANARQMVKPTGMLVDLDWKKESTPFGPPLSIRFDEAKATRLIEAAGFKVADIKASGHYHYLITARPV